MSDGGTLPGANNQRARGPAPANGPAPSYAVAVALFEGQLILGVTGLETAGVEIVQAVIRACTQPGRGSPGWDNKAAKRT